MEANGKLLSCWIPEKRVWNGIVTQAGKPDLIEPLTMEDSGTKLSTNLALDR